MQHTGDFLGFINCLCTSETTLPPNKKQANPDYNSLDDPAAGALGMINHAHAVKGGISETWI